MQSLKSEYCSTGCLTARQSTRVQIPFPLPNKSTNAIKDSTVIIFSSLNFSLKDLTYIYHKCSF